MLYVKDVRYIIDGQCKVLQDLVRMFPNCKWIIVGGSPCQDLTFAGPWRGLLGLIGPSSRLFFVLLCVISAMQRLVGPAAVRYLVENAASMLQIHLDAFCQLLRIPVDYHGRYVWDPCDFGFEVTRRRNYFRNFDDIEEIGIPTRVFESEVGPLIDQAEKCIPFAPSCRMVSSERLGHSTNRMRLCGIMPSGMVKSTLARRAVWELTRYHTSNGSKLYLPPS